MNHLMHPDLFILIILTAVWCFFHSILISTRLINFLKKILDSKFRYYRIAYNLFSFVTFIFIVRFEMNIRQEIIFHWIAYYRIIQILFFILALSLFYLGAKQYSFLEFIGINQIKMQNINLSISHNGELNSTGIHRITRHPWYLGTLIIIWLRDLSISIIGMNLILSAYLIIGAYVEERKLILEFGQNYINYKKQVSMLIPFKWLYTSFMKSKSEDKQ